ncbi:hypothetical protein ISN45_Aa03g003160 [Arabidopsis thaliana x Arabidopsis arenosa]|uniref:Uncharacterized protein n=1 Tax=Arabidopsis thaliana x Arabidopsis arenosa TaxID=1240361 RepID=A0A8T2AV31_9BRAS|nr:hypothetical protein ISN45_Aa03g003160 [Arabidopsis thaliana x Arabidopsis arenosa]
MFSFHKLLKDITLQAYKMFKKNTKSNGVNVKGLKKGVMMMESRRENVTEQRNLNLKVLDGAIMIFEYREYVMNACKMCVCVTYACIDEINV